MLINEAEGINQTIDFPDDEYILEEVRQRGLYLPYFCLAGAYSTCTGEIVKGKVHQDHHSYLDDDRIAAGYVLTCIATPRYYCTIETYQQKICNKLFNHN
ncbi:MAG: 2Fe-2S iron-sulfur cluster-binding protein [Microcoleaceae cyanobacterium]